MINYYLNPAISNSSLSYIDPKTGGCPQKFYDYINGKLESEKTPSLERGDYIHQYILTPEEFSVLTCKMPSDTVRNIIKGIYVGSENTTPEERTALNLLNFKAMLLNAANVVEYQTNWKDETRVTKLIEVGMPYFEALKVAGNRTIVDGEVYEKVKRCSESVRRNNAAKLLLFDSPGQEVFNEMEIYWEEEWAGMKLTFKAKLDRLVIDHTAKTFSIVDFKTTSKNIIDFPESVEYYHYYRQISFYDHAVKVWLEQKGYQNYTSDDHYIVAVETKGYYLCRVYVISEPYQRMGRKETAALLNRIVYHYSTGDWENQKEEQEVINKTYILMPKEYV